MDFQYSPGLLGYGAKGTDGSIGSQGLALYFTDYDPISNFIDIKAAIENNYVLWSTAPPETSLPQNRVYQEGDLFIDSRGAVYAIHPSLNDFFPINAILNKANFFQPGSTTTDGTFNRWFNINDGSVKYIIDNNKSNKSNYLYPQKIYNIDLKEFNRIEYTDNSNGAFTLYSTGETSGIDDSQALALIRDVNGFRIGNFENVIRNTNLSLDVENLFIKKEDSNRFNINTPKETILTNSEIDLNNLFYPNFISNSGYFQSYSSGSDDITLQWMLTDFTLDPSVKGDLYFYDGSINYSTASFTTKDVSRGSLIFHDVSPTGSVSITSLGLGTKWEYYILLHKDGWERKTTTNTAITGGNQYLIKVLKPASKILTVDYLGTVIGEPKNIDVSAYVFSTWKASSGAYWMTFVPPIPQFGSGLSTFDVSIQKNLEVSPRTGNISLSGISAPTENIIVNQLSLINVNFNGTGYLQFSTPLTDQTVSITLSLSIKACAEGSGAKHRRTEKFISVWRGSTNIQEISSGIADGGASHSIKQNTQSYTFTVSAGESIRIRFYSKYSDGSGGWSTKAEGLDCIYGSNIIGSYHRKGGGWAQITAVTKTLGNGHVSLASSNYYYYQKKDTNNCTLYSGAVSSQPTINT
jgi:hypothetical protein